MALTITVENGRKAMITSIYYMHGLYEAQLQLLNACHSVTPITFFGGRLLSFWCALGLCMQDYKSLCAAVITSLVNTQTDTLTAYINSSAMHFS